MFYTANETLQAECLSHPAQVFSLIAEAGTDLWRGSFLCHECNFASPKKNPLKCSQLQFAQVQQTAVTLTAHV